MRKLKILLLTVVVSGVVSCIDAVPRNTAPPDTTPKISKYQQLINRWIGRPANDMLKKWGAPNKAFTLAGKEYIVYSEISTVSRRGYCNRYGSCTSGYSYEVTDCTYTFEIRRGVIVGGNAKNHNSDGCDYHL